MATMDAKASTLNLLQYWSRSRIDLGAPASSADIAEFERRHSVQLCSAIREYYLAANGFQAPRDQDEDGFSWWPLDQVCLVEELEDGGWSSGETKDCFVFADYLSLSWAYAFRSAGADTRIYIVGSADGQPQWIAESFEEFVTLYASNDPRLYPTA